MTDVSTSSLEAALLGEAHAAEIGNDLQVADKLLDRIGLLAIRVVARKHTPDAATTAGAAQAMLDLRRLVRSADVWVAGAAADRRLLYIRHSHMHPARPPQAWNLRNSRHARLTLTFAEDSSSRLPSMQTSRAGIEPKT